MKKRVIEPKITLAEELQKSKRSLSGFLDYSDEQKISALIRSCRLDFLDTSERNKRADNALKVATQSYAHHLCIALALKGRTESLAKALLKIGKILSEGGNGDRAVQACEEFRQKTPNFYQ